MELKTGMIVLRFEALSWVVRFPRRLGPIPQPSLLRNTILCVPILGGNHGIWPSMITSVINQKVLKVQVYRTLLALLPEYSLIR